jgi:hypothetical protein
VATVGKANRTNHPVAANVRCTITLAELLSGLERAVDVAPGAELSEGMADRLENLARAVRLKVAGSQP